MSTPYSSDDIVQMELAAARAWPAARSVDVDGWRVRLSGGGTRRANSVLPLAYTGRDLTRAITAVEAHYRAQNTRCYFQVTSIAAPSTLDTELARRGYTYEEPCVLMAKPLMPSAMPDNVTVTDGPTAAWLAVYGELLDAARTAALPTVLAAVPSPRGFLLLTRAGAALSSALAVVSPEGIALVECVATLSAARRSGGAQIVMDALEAWSAAQGAHTCVLQVVASNAPARRLYEARGYIEVGRYHYRWRDVG
jgi:N-acetylglutamate synthase